MCYIFTWSSAGHFCRVGGERCWKVVVAVEKEEVFKCLSVLRIITDVLSFVRRLPSSRVTEEVSVMEFYVPYRIRWLSLVCFTGSQEVVTAELRFCWR